MKEFLKTYAIFFIFVIAFNFCGGYLLFDLNHFFRFCAAIALILTIAFRMWYSTEDRVDALEKELQKLKKQINSEPSESEDIKE